MTCAGHGQSLRGPDVRDNNLIPMLHMNVKNHWTVWPTTSTILILGPSATARTGRQTNSSTDR